jgi:gas vesicle protein
MASRRLAYFTIGALTGTAIGIMVGVLFAPMSGAQTRRRLAEEARRVAEAAHIVADRAEQTALVLGERMDRYFGRDEEVAWRKVREIREGVQRYTHAQLP